MSIRTLRSIQIHPWIKVDHKYFPLLPKTHAYIKTRIDDPRRLRRAVASPGDTNPDPKFTSLFVHFSSLNYPADKMALPPATIGRPWLHLGFA